MNRKGVALFMVMYSVVFLVVVVWILLAITSSSLDHDAPKIGELQEQVYDVYQRSDAVHVYAQYAAHKAFLRAAQEGDASRFADTSLEYFSSYMAAYPEPIRSQYTIERSEEGYIFTSTQPIVLKIAPSVTRNTLGNTGAGVFTVWPVDTTLRAPTLTSLFGSRDVSSGSVSHPAIDMRSSPGDPIYAIGSGEILSLDRSDNYNQRIWISFTNGYTCGYYHTSPLSSLRTGDTVVAGEQIGTTQSISAPHLDLRCFDHVSLLSEAQAKEVFGSEHVRESHLKGTYQAGDSLYIGIANSPQGTSAFIDPYCLFSEEMQSQLQLGDLSGLKYRDPGTVQDQLAQTCAAYGEKQLITFSSEAGMLYADQLINELIDEREGVIYTNTKGDIPTKFGITNETLAAYEKRAVTEQDVQALTREKAEEIYSQNYLSRPHIDQLPAELIPAVFDAGVDMDVGTANEMLRDVVYIADSDDGSTWVFSDELIGATQLMIQDVGIEEVLDRYADRRIEEYNAILVNKPEKERFRNNWMERAELFRTSQGAYELVKESARSSVGSYSFPFSIESAVPSEATDLLSSVASVRLGLENSCQYHDIACQNQYTTQLDNPSYTQCSLPQEEILQTVRSCLDNSCGCLIPLPIVGMMEFSTNAITYNSISTYIDWTGEGEDGESSVKFIVDGTVGEKAQLTASGVGVLDAHNLIDASSLATLGQTVWIYPKRVDDELQITFSLERENVCEERIARKYCSGESEFWVLHKGAEPISTDFSLEQEN